MSEERESNGFFWKGWEGDYERLVAMAVIQIQYAVVGYPMSGDTDLAFRILEHDVQRQAFLPASRSGEVNP